MPNVLKKKKNIDGSYEKTSSKSPILAHTENFETVVSDAVPERKHRSIPGFLVIQRRTIFIGMIVILAGTSVYFFYQYHQLSMKSNGNAAASGASDVSQLVSKVGNIMLLPTEVPTVATVSDRSKLASQAFFVNAQDGDKVLIYSNAKEAILYRPTANKIINVAPLNLPAPTAPAAPLSEPNVIGASTSATLKVVLYNGTKTVGLTKTAEKDITTKFPNLTIADRSNAKSGAYTTTLVIDLSGSHAKDAQDLATSLHATVSSLPAGETKPDADLLVILGKDYVAK